MSAVKQNAIAGMVPAEEEFDQDRPALDEVPAVPTGGLTHIAVEVALGRVEYLLGLLGRRNTRLGGAMPTGEIRLMLARDAAKELKIVHRHLEATRPVEGLPSSEGFEEARPGKPR